MEKLEIIHPHLNLVDMIPPPLPPCFTTTSKIKVVVVLKHPVERDRFLHELMMELQSDREA